MTTSDTTGKKTSRKKSAAKKSTTNKWTICVGSKDGACEIRFDEKPTKQIRDELSTCFFKWSGFNQCYWGAAALLKGTVYETKAKRYMGRWK